MWPIKNDQNNKSNFVKCERDSGGSSACSCQVHISNTASDHHYCDDLYFIFYNLYFTFPTPLTTIYQTREGTWSQLALSIQGRSSVKTFLNCVWAGTQIIDGRLANIIRSASSVSGSHHIIIVVLNNIWACVIIISNDTSSQSSSSLRLSSPATTGPQVPGRRGRTHQNICFFRICFTTGPWLSPPILTW